MVLKQHHNLMYILKCDKKKGMAIVKSEVLEDTMDKIMPDNK